MRIRKLDIAEQLALTEVSVHLDQQTFAYWRRTYMRCTLPDLRARLVRRADQMTDGNPDRFAAVPARLQQGLVELALEVLP